MGDESTPETGEDTFEPITSQEQLDKIVKQRVSRERAKYADYDDLKAKAAELDKHREASKTEAEKLTERLTSLERELEAERHTALKATVAAAKGVPANRINGATREELEADADEFLALLKAKQAQDKPKVTTGLKSGASGDDARMNGKEKTAAALRSLYRS